MSVRAYKYFFRFEFRSASLTTKFFRKGFEEFILGMRLVNSYPILTIKVL